MDRKIREIRSQKSAVESSHMSSQKSARQSSHMSSQKSARESSHMSCRNTNHLSSRKSTHNLQKINNAIEIRNNDELSECSLDALCNHLFESDQSIQIANNSEGCSDIQDAINNCLGPNGFWLSKQTDVDNFKI